LLFLNWNRKVTPDRSSWHGESGNDWLRRGHLTVNFKRMDGSHMTTAHVYYCDEAYFEM
jgi:hypothetical protein